jgi:hypothetical protein
VECKLWARKVTKLHVAALARIVEDVGADRGILLCEAGFQPGARKLAELSNITLTSLADMRASAAGERAERGTRDAQLANAIAKWRELQALTDEPMPGPVREVFLSNIDPEEAKTWGFFSQFADVPSKFDDFVGRVRAILWEINSSLSVTYDVNGDYVILTPSGYMSSAHAEKVRQVGKESPVKYMMTVLVFDQ